MGGRVVHLSHGDLVNPDDRGYLFLRWFLRSAFIRFLIALTPSRVHVAIGSYASGKSRAYTATKDDPMEALSEAYARDRIRKGADVVVIGHTHIPACVELEADGRSGHYVNTGLWEADGSRYWARIDASGVVLHHVPGGG